MFEGLFPWRTATTDERPPEPDPKPRSVTGKLTRYEATITYRNGDTETFECYGIYTRTDAVVKFKVDPYGGPGWRDSEEAKIHYNKRSVNYEILAREPELEPVATDTFRLDWVEGYEYRQERMASYGSPKSWHPEPTDIELTVERGDD